MTTSNDNTCCWLTTCILCCLTVYVTSGFILIGIGSAELASMVLVNGTLLAIDNCTSECFINHAQHTVCQQSFICNLTWNVQNETYQQYNRFVNWQQRLFNCSVANQSVDVVLKVPLYNQSFQIEPPGYVMHSADLDSGKGMFIVLGVASLAACAIMCCDCMGDRFCSQRRNY